MADKNIIHVSDLTKTFNGFTAVNHISFSVAAGEIFAFLGPNGAGKSTTINMLTTLLRPTSGSISLNGYDPVTSPHRVRQSFGIVFQDPSLDEDLTAWENMDYHGILYGISRNIRGKRSEELLKIVELWERRKEQVKKFSGGMKRRLEIARGLLHHPKILFLDEPTLGPVSYTHLTLPTTYSVYISVVAVSLKKKSVIPTQQRLSPTLSQQTSTTDRAESLCFLTSYDLAIIQITPSLQS